MGKKNTKGTQKVNPTMDAGIVSPPYETAFAMSNTEEAKRSKKEKNVDLHSCKCKNKKNNNIRKPTRTWESITNLYGDADTTEVWDNQEHKPNFFFSSKLNKQEDSKPAIDQPENKDVVIYPTSNLKNTPAKLSLFGLNRKRKKNRNKIKIEQFINENSEDTDVKFSQDSDSKLNYLLSKKPKKGFIDPYTTREICTEGPCHEALENLYKLHGLKYIPNKGDNITKSGHKDKSKKEKNKIKTAKEIKIIKKSKNKQAKVIKTKKDGNVGYGDQFPPIPLNNQDSKDIQYKNSFIRTMMGHTNCKCKNDNENTLQTSSNVNGDIGKTDKTKTEITKEENKITKKSKNKQLKAPKASEDGNVGYGDQISPIPLKKQDLKDVQYKRSFIGKMMGHINGKYKNDNGNTLLTSSNVNDDIGKTDKTKTEIPTKEYKIIKKSKNKQPKAIKATKDGNVGYGDQILPIPLKKQDLKDVQFKRSFIGKMMEHINGKYKNDNGNALQTSSNIKNPTDNSLLEMKVNLTDMRVINSFEVNENIRKLGRIDRDKSCICPSHMKRSICERGPCEKALKNPQTRFSCKCPKQNIIECKDSTCDMKIHDIKLKSKPKKKSRSPVYKDSNKPLFEVMLDPTDMNVINAHEIKDIIGQASQNKTKCSTGICNKLSKQQNLRLNCKCVGKKLSPPITDCEERTCRNPEKKCKLSYLCSRVFSKSENWTGQNENRQRWPVRGNGYDKNVKRGDVVARSHYKRNGVMINLPRGQTPKKGTYVGGKLSDVWCKCFCECDKKSKKPPLKKKKIKKVKKKKKESKRRRRRKAFFRKKKIDDRSCKEKCLDSLDREHEKCEKRMKMKFKEYERNEKRAIKENEKMDKEEKDAYKTQNQNWNCLTNFISGFLNVTFESVKTVFKVTFSLILDPITSFIYIREKGKDPPAAIARIIEWFIRKWKNKSSLIAQSIDNSFVLNVIADQIESSPIYNALVPHGKTTAERMAYERRIRVRKRRMRKREDEALFGCRHMMLTTMRKTPCLWFYHICPDLYPQCLSFVAVMTNFVHVLLYCGAIMCWTPCIVACEMCRACMCCFLCTH